MPEKIEEKGIALTIHEEPWPYIDEFFRNVPEAMKKEPTFQEALEASERRGATQNQQQTLLLILHHRFGTIPHWMVQKIETVDELPLLAKWVEQVLDKTYARRRERPQDAGLPPGMAQEPTGCPDSRLV